jgi:hypothetical protein
MIPGRARNRKRFAQPGATRKEYRSQHVPGEELELKSQRLNMPMIGQTIPDGTMTPTDSLRLFWLAGLYGMDLFRWGLFLCRFEQECLVSADRRGRKQHAKETSAVEI